MVKAGRARYIGISNCFAWQLTKANALAEKRNVSMTEIALSWLLTKATAPVVGATRLQHIEGAAKAAELFLTDGEISYLEEPYVPHKLVGIMAQI